MMRLAAKNCSLTCFYVGPTNEEGDLVGKVERERARGLVFEDAIPVRMNPPSLFRCISAHLPLLERSVRSRGLGFTFI
jgi:hypothetical protein